ncbi:MAG TPA: hypothetical protein VKZ59_02325 [Acidobacteriota bacterium]|nr:hypothetical protein [Acidobacteriota bacterium]
MELLPKQLASNLPAIGSSLGIPLEDTIVHIRYFDSSTSWRWYVLEFDGKDTFFGLLISDHLVTAGQFTLTELQSIRNEDGHLSIRRDLEFSFRSVRDLVASEPEVVQLLKAPGPTDEAASSLVQIEESD